MGEEHRLRVFENRMLRRIFGPKKEGLTREWRKLHDEELNDLYSLPNIDRVIKSRKMRWAWHVARMGDKIGVYRVLVGKSEERDHLEDPGVDGRIILSWIFRTWDGGKDWIELAQDRYRWRALVNVVMNLGVP
jgi:hypothetical protein